MKVLYSFNNILSKVEDLILSWAILIMAALLIFNAVGRTIFGFSVGVIGEISVYLMMILTFIGLSNAARKGKHIIMSVVLDFSPFKLRKTMIVIGDIVSILFMIMMVWVTAKYTGFVYSTGRVLPASGAPMWTLMIAMPIGFALGAFQYILTLISNLHIKGKAFLGPEVEYLTEKEEAEHEIELDSQNSEEEVQ